MRTSNHGRKFLEIEEGRALFDSNSGLYFPYRDSIGKWTIGVGHLIRSDEDFSMGITAERVDQLLAADLIKCDVAIDGIKCPVALTQNQHDAIASWLFNVGTGWARPDKSSLVRAIVNGQYERVPELLLMYDVADGKHVAYLHARRMREGKLWSTPDTESLEDVYSAASRASALKFTAIDLLSEEDLGKKVEEVSGVQWDPESEEDTVPRRNPGSSQ